MYSSSIVLFFFFNDTATTEIYTLSLHDALPIYDQLRALALADLGVFMHRFDAPGVDERPHVNVRDRKSTRLNSSHMSISYAVFCLKKKKKNNIHYTDHHVLLHITSITTLLSQHY